MRLIVKGMATEEHAEPLYLGVTRRIASERERVRENDQVILPSVAVNVKNILIGRRKKIDLGWSAVADHPRSPRSSVGQFPQNCDAFFERFVTGRE